MVQTATYARRQFEWYDLVELSGEDGCRWMAGYRRYRHLTGAIANSLPAMRKGDFATGERLLASAWDGLCTEEFEDPTMRAVAERWYYGALGYALYRREAFDEADEVMARAHDVVAAALGRWDFLLIMADEAVDLRMHRARIARNRGRWDEMRRHFDAAWAMREGQVPYHVLPDGTRIGAAEVRAFVNRLPVPGGAGLVMPHLQDPAQARRDFERFVRDIVRIPGFVVHQP
jgi:hypothetical protein